MKHRGRRAGLIMVAAFAGLIVGASVVWAALTALRAPEDPSEAQAHTHVSVVEGTVGAEMMLNAVAEWKPVPVGENRAAGVVTSVSVLAGDEATQGTVLYSVDLRPVVVASGDVPAFREIAEGTTGPDVAQLQQLLTDLGLYEHEVDGKAGAATVRGIMAWQKSLDLAQTGVVGPGDVIFVPTLPTRVALDVEKVHRGATLVGGEAILRGLPAMPEFIVPVTESQAAMMPTGTQVLITAPDGSQWEGLAEDQERDGETHTVTVHLAGVDGAAICRDSCEQVPVTGQARLASRIVTVETVAGLVIPSAALVTTADGGTAVIGEDGTRIAVTVITSARGMSVVEGVDAGVQVRVPAKEDGA